VFYHSILVAHSFCISEIGLILVFGFALPNNKITGWNRIRVTSANEPKIAKDPDLAQKNRRFQSGAFFG
ncbi:MAG: hypothetical protein JXI43_09620, partial [Tissierellales bacterium]|nr:hypothetical protein [Tissierellales bacterium]